MGKMEPLDTHLRMLFRPVALFEDVEVMGKALNRMRQFGWTVHEFDCRQFDTQEQLLNAVLHGLGLRERYYKNVQMIQFWDLLRDVRIPEGTGLTLAFSYLEDFFRKDPDCVRGLVASVAGEHSYQLRQGFRLMACGHIEDKSIQFEQRSIDSASHCVMRHWTEEEIEEGRKHFDDMRRQRREAIAAAGGHLAYRAERLKLKAEKEARENGRN